MSRYSKLFLKPFIGGLNTEQTSVEDMVLNTSDELNCTILPEAIRGRRYGLNIERDGSWIKAEPTRSYSGYLWKNVNKTSRNFIVQQINTVLKFFDATLKPLTNTDSEGNLTSFIGEVDLSNYVINSLNDGIGPLNYAIGNGNLFIVNTNIKPVQIIHTVDDDGKASFDLQPFNLYIRDLDGVEDGLDIDEMPFGSTSTSDLYHGLSSEHHYNLLNQGWNETDLIQFVTDKSKWPSNNLQWFIGKDDSGAYNTDRLLKKYFGNTPAPKGHFIIDYFEQNRSDVSGIFGADAKVGVYDYQDTWIRHRKLRGTIINEFTVNIPNTAGKLSAIVMRFTKLFRRSSKKHGSNDWTGRIHFYVYGITGIKRQLYKRSTWSKGYYAANEVRYTLREQIYEEEIQVYGASSSDPLLHRMMIKSDKDYEGYIVRAVFSKGNSQNHNTSNQNPLGVTCHAYGWMQGEDSSIFPTVNAANTVADITYMGNRLFYLVNDTVLFSQAIGNNGKGFESCYQDADPTSEEISDILPTDGGSVKFNNIGAGRALESFNRGVLVFGDNIVYGLISPVEKLFTATEYDVIELSRAGIIGPRSVVSTDDMVYYWSPLGIFRIGINPNTGNSIIAQSITNSTIQTFYNNILNESKKYCRGAFDYINNRIYWYYPSTDQYHKLDRCLVYDLTYNSFMPFKIGDVQEEDEDEGTVETTNETFVADCLSTNLSYEIEPTMFLRAGGTLVTANNSPVVATEEKTTKYSRWTALQHFIANDDGDTSIGDYNDREFKDFERTVFDSYMLSRPITVDDTYYNKQVPIMQTLFKRTEEAELNGATEYLRTTYTLTDNRSYRSSHQRFQGHNKAHCAVADAVKTYGCVHSCDIQLDCSELLTEAEDDRTIVAEVSCGGKQVGRKYINLGTDLGSSYNVHIDCDNSVHGDNIHIFVYVGNASVTPGLNNNIHFTATVDFTNTRPQADVFTGWKEVVTEGEVTMPTTYKGSVQDPTDVIPVSIPASFMKKIEITSEPALYNVGEDMSWSIPLAARAKGGGTTVNFFYEEATHQQVNYNVASSTYPTRSPNPESIAEYQTLSTYLEIGKNGNFLHSNCDADEITFKYRLTHLVPEFKPSDYVSKPAKQYVAASGAYIRMRWGWSLTDRSNRWDMIQNAYRPQKDFLHDEYVESRLHIRGRGKAFQVEIRNDENKDMRLAGLNLIIRNP